MCALGLDCLAVGVPWACKEPHENMRIVRVVLRDGNQAKRIRVSLRVHAGRIIGSEASAQGIPSTLVSEILVPRVLWWFKNHDKSENSKIREITLRSFTLKLNNIFTFF
jgi:hypothetical protein